MSLTALRPTQIPHVVQDDWFWAGLGVSASAAGNNINSVYYNGKTYAGFCDGDGNARIAQYVHSTHVWTVSAAIVTGLGADAHCKLVLAVSPHAAAHMYIAISTNAEDITAWGAPTDIESTLTGSPLCTYANLFQLSGESGKIYLFYRAGSSNNGQLYYSTSTDAGATWSAATEVYTAGSVGAYWAVDSDDTSRIDFLVSDGNAPHGDAASAYHFYYTGGTYYKSDGTHITASLPLGPSNITKIYNQSLGSVRAPYSIVTNGGDPVAVWAAYDPAGSGSDEHYWYGAWTGGAWNVNEIDDAGSPPDVNFAEGGVAVNAADPTSVFVSRDISDIWQMFVYQTADAGSTWTSDQKTDDALLQPTDAYNLRPCSPRNAVTELSAVWFFGPHFVLSSGAEPPASQMRGYPNPA